MEIWLDFERPAGIVCGSVRCALYFSGRRAFLNVCLTQRVCDWSCTSDKRRRTVFVSSRMDGPQLSKEKGWVTEGKPQKEKEVVRAAGIEPARTSRSYGFSYHFGFRRRPWPGVCGLDYPFTLAISFRRCPSSLYTFPYSGLGSGLPVKVSPNLSSSTSRVSLGALNLFGLSPLRLPVSPRPHARNDIVRLASLLQG